MARESAIDLLDPEDKKWLDRRFFDCGFNGYDEIARILEERGYNISKSSIHRYGQKVEKKLAAMQASTQAAMLFKDSVKDDSGNLNSAVLTMVQSGYFECLVALQEINEETDPEKRLLLLGKISKGIAEISRTSIDQKKWETNIRKQAQDELLREQEANLDAAVSAQGMTEEQAMFWREKVLGIRQ